MTLAQLFYVLYENNFVEIIVKDDMGYEVERVEEEAFLAKESGVYVEYEDAEIDYVEVDEVTLRIEIIDPDYEQK